MPYSWNATVTPFTNNGKHTQHISRRWKDIPFDGGRTGEHANAECTLIRMHTQRLSLLFFSLLFIFSIRIMFRCQPTAKRLNKFAPSFHVLVAAFPYFCFIFLSQFCFSFHSRQNRFFSCIFFSLFLLQSHSLSSVLQISTPVSIILHGRSPITTPMLAAIVVVATTMKMMMMTRVFLFIYCLYIKHLPASNHNG